MRESQRSLFLFTAMNYTFDKEDAIRLGSADLAVILWNIKWWCEKNKANAKHYHEGLYWTYNSVNAWVSLFPWLSEDQIDRRLRKLEELGEIKSGNFNSNQYDRTKWYASIPQNHGMEFAEMRNGNRENAEPIPDSKPDSKPFFSKNRKKTKTEFKNSESFSPETFYTLLQKEITRAREPKLEKVDIRHYYNKLSLWSGSRKKTSDEWVSYAIMFMINDLSENKLRVKEPKPKNEVKNQYELLLENNV